MNGPRSMATVRGLAAVAALWTLLTVTAGCPGKATTDTPDSGQELGGGADSDLDDGDADLRPELKLQEPLAGTTLAHDFTRTSGFYASPFPNENRRNPDGRIDLSDFPNPTGTEIVEQLRTLVTRDTDGFGATTPVFFQLDGALATEGLPDIHRSVEPDSPIFLIDVDPASPDLGRRYPVDTDFQVDAGPYGDSMLLGILPLQGLALGAATRYAVVVTTGLKDSDGAALGRGDSLSELLSGIRPQGMSAAAHEHYREAVLALRDLGVTVGDIAGLAVFVTADPGASLRRYVDDALSQPLPQVTGIEPGEVFDTFCVFEGTFLVPNYQHGSPPYSTEGGDWRLDASGAPLKGTPETSRLVLTLPRSPMPADGYPVTVMIRTGGGGDRPLVDRGPRATNGGPAIDPGTGPALHFAAEGFAGATFDGPHGGPRNASGGDEQFLMFNVANAAAMRDNVRQTALEAAVVAHILSELTLDASTCPGASPQARFDGRVGAMALMGHSMGATVAPLTLAVEPRYGAAILSGAGGSWVENVMFKQLPLEVRPLAELLVGYSDRSLHRFDPALGLLQWGLEPADPPVYGRLRGDGTPPHVLMLQGIVDRYILPSIANATSLSHGLSLAGESLDAASVELDAFRPLEEVLYLAGQSPLPYPVSANYQAGDSSVTAVVAQHPQGPIEDGHEVMFQTDGPKHQYRCFLQTWKRAGTPTVPAPSTSECSP